MPKKGHFVQKQGCGEGGNFFALETIQITLYKSGSGLQLPENKGKISGKLEIHGLSRFLHRPGRHLPRALPISQKHLPRLGLEALQSGPFLPERREVTG